MNLIGKMLGNRYEILEKIGNGGMATVYKAKCHVLNRFVAVKILRDEFTTDSEFIKRFNSEAQSAASLTHPNIVSIFDVGNEDNLYYIVMELIQGKTLKEIIDEDGILSWKWSVNIAIQIASALEMAHKNNIIHRDIKPHNIIITEDGVAKVTDFGIAKAVSNSTITAFGTTIGSVHYFSPEHAKGGFTDSKSDLYSLGIVMYEMLTGRVPFDADTPVSVALKQVQEEPIEPIKLNSKIPISVNRIILKAMRKEPALRYQTATEMLEDLNTALKRPNDDFIGESDKDSTSPTQKIPVINSEEKKEEKKGFGAFLKKHKVFRFFFVIFLAILLFLSVMFGTIKILKSLRPKQAQIPELVWLETDKRLTKQSAIDRLNSAGFKNYEVQEEYSDKVEEGFVISQNPAFQNNFSINLNQKITLVVSKGQKTISIPEKLVGKKIEEVKTELDKLEAKYEVEEVNDEEVEAGILLEMDPKEGTDIPATTTIALKVSKGSAYKDIVVKNVIGKSEEEALKQLKEDGFTEVTVEYEENTNKADGTVLEQSVASGKTIKENEPIVLTVNKLPEDHTLTVNVSIAAEKEEKPKDNTTKITNTTNTTPTPTATPTPTPTQKSYTIEIMVNGKSVKTETVKPGGKMTATYVGTGSKVKVEVQKNGTDLQQKTVDLTSGDQTVSFEY